MIKLILTVLSGALLSGCMTVAEQTALDDSKCRGYGAVPGTQPYVSCRTALDTTRTQARAIRAAAPDPAPRPWCVGNVCTFY
jgi:hypothetical protein